MLAGVPGVPECVEFENLVDSTCVPCGDEGGPVCVIAHACNPGNWKYAGKAYASLKRNVI